MTILFHLTANIVIDSKDIEINAIRSQGPGGQHVNKTASAILLQFDVNKSTLPDSLKVRINNYSDYRISVTGLVTIKAQRYKSQEQNKEDAIHRLQQLLANAIKVDKPRKPTKPSKAVVSKRLDSKTKSKRRKQQREKPKWDD